MNTQITDMFVLREIRMGRERRVRLSQASDEELERITDRYIPNPLKRAYTRLFVSYSTPSTAEYKDAINILAERRR